MNRQTYLVLQQQKSVLEKRLNPSANDAAQANEIPADFNQTGWDLTIAKLESLIEKLKILRDNKGRRLTPPFYRSVYNRCVIASEEADKTLESLTASNTPQNINYEAECIKLNAEIYNLNLAIEEKAKADAAKKVGALQPEK